VPCGYGRHAAPLAAEGYRVVGLDRSTAQLDEARRRRATASQPRLVRADYHLAIVLKAAERLIGGCRIEIRSAAHGSGDVGYVLDRQHWGHGYMTEATRALVGFGFGRLALHRIWAACDVDNHASARVLEKLGMRREGHLRQSRRQQGEWRDSYLYAILEPDWRERSRPA
jgi:RimJ/RimL family protein N-acetyltransferase